MITIKLKPRLADAALLAELEKKKLIKTLKPSKRVLYSRRPGGAMETVYCSHHRWGGHKLICVKKNSSAIKLTSHPDNEEFIILNNNGTKFRPLVIIIALHKDKRLADKLNKSGISPEDFMAVEFAYNDHRTCVFTMLKDTVHCEVALSGKGQGPVFFVSEPSRLKLHNFRTKGYKLEI